MRKVMLVVALMVAVGAGGLAWMTSRSPATGATAGQAAKDTTRYIARVTAEQMNEGTVYHVRPTRAGRLAVGGALDTAWQQAVELGVPDRESIKHQFLCHPYSVVARAKDTWDVESWRPNVGQVRTMLAGCDPE